MIRSCGGEVGKGRMVNGIRRWEIGKGLGREGGG